MNSSEFFMLCWLDYIFRNPGCRQRSPHARDRHGQSSSHPSELHSLLPRKLLLRRADPELPAKVSRVANLPQSGLRISGPHNPLLCSSGLRGRHRCPHHSLHQVEESVSSYYADCAYMVVAIELIRATFQGFQLSTYNCYL